MVSKPTLYLGHYVPAFCFYHPAGILCRKRRDVNFLFVLRQFLHLLLHIGWKSPKMSHMNLVILHQFLPYVKLTCLVTLFDHKFNIRKISQINHFCIFDKLLFPKCKRSSLRSQCCKNETFSAIFQHRVLLLFFSFSSCCRPYKWIHLKV